MQVLRNTLLPILQLLLPIVLPEPDPHPFGVDFQDIFQQTADAPETAKIAQIPEQQAADEYLPIGIVGHGFTFHKRKGSQAQLAVQLFVMVESDRRTAHGAAVEGKVDAMIEPADGQPADQAGGKEVGQKTQR